MPESEQSHLDPELINPKPANLIERIRARMIGSKIKVVDLPSQTDDLADLIRIIDPEQQAVEEQIVIHDQASPNDLVDSINIIDPEQQAPETTAEEEAIEIGIEPFIRLAVSAQENQESAQSFMQVMRSTTPELLGDACQRPSYTENQWYHFDDLRQLADRWNLPLMLIVKNQNHYLLLLSLPEKHGDTYQALVYDPLKGGEEYMELPNWDNSLSPANLTENWIFFNDSGYQAATARNYNLSLFGDEDFAGNLELHQAKNTRVQFDGHNCGPACLYMAALRWAVQPDWNEFKFAGRDQLTNDTGLTVLTREEILENIDLGS
jgi:hypothetical protein